MANRGHFGLASLGLCSSFVPCLVLNKYLLIFQSCFFYLGGIFANLDMNCFFEHLMTILTTYLSLGLYLPVIDITQFPYLWALTIVTQLFFRKYTVYLSMIFFIVCPSWFSSILNWCPIHFILIFQILSLTTCLLCRKFHMIILCVYGLNFNISLYLVLKDFNNEM